MSIDLEALLARLRPHALPLVVGALGVLCILIGVVYALISSNKDQGVIFDASDQEASTVATHTALLVDVSGAVVHPGVYKFLASARVQDALIAAGGLSALADRDWVSKNLNLANKLSDAAKVYIPQKNEAAWANKTAVTGTKSENPSGLTNINSASLSELDKLPGIGPVTASKIINGRPYADINDLLTKKIVNQKVFDQIKVSISVY